MTDMRLPHGAIQQRSILDETYLIVFSDTGGSVQYGGESKICLSESDLHRIFKSGTYVFAKLCPNLDLDFLMIVV